MQVFARIVFFFAAMLVVACASRVGGVRRALAELDGATTVGINYVDFVHKLQDVGGAIAIAKQDGATERDLQPFEKAFEIYTRSSALWQQKIDCPAAFGPGDPNGCRTERIFQDLREVAKLYDVKFDQLDEAAIRDYEKEMAFYETKVEKIVARGSTPYDAGISRPAPYALQRANGHVVDAVLAAMWQKAALASK
jgi:hypothetical protein